MCTSQYVHSRESTLSTLYIITLMQRNHVDMLLTVPPTIGPACVYTGLSQTVIKHPSFVVLPQYDWNHDSII